MFVIVGMDSVGGTAVSFPLSSASTEKTINRTNEINPNSMIGFFI
jgi:hypothetical protein